MTNSTSSRRDLQQQLRCLLAICTLGLLLGFSFGPTPAWADAELVGQMDAYVVTTNAEGIDIYEEAASANPGDVIEYRLTYSNHGDEAISRLQVIGPVPQGAFYLTDTASRTPGDQMEVSIDKGVTWATPPLYRTVLTEEGRMVRVPVSATEYQLLRWTPKTDLQPDNAISYAYRVQIRDF